MKFSSLLKPDDPRGIKMVHVTSNPDVLTEGIKTGKQLQSEGKEFGRSIYHPYSFFRPPMERQTEKWKKSFNPCLLNQKNRIIVVVNVDPGNAYIYPSEFRTHAENFGKETFKLKVIL